MDKETQKKVLKARDLVKAGESVADAIKIAGISHHSYYYKPKSRSKKGEEVKEKRKYTPRKSNPTITEIEAPSFLSSSGGKTLIVITDDKELIASIIGSYR